MCHWYLAATCSVLVLPEECCGGFFWEITSGFFPYSALFGSTVDTCVCQSSEAWGLLVVMHLALCSLLVCCIMAGMDQQEQFVYWSCPRRTGYWFFWEMTSMSSVFSAQLGSKVDTCTASVYGACEACVSVFSAQLGSTADTCSASVYEAFLEEFHTFST